MTHKLARREAIFGVVAGGAGLLAACAHAADSEKTLTSEGMIGLKLRVIHPGEVVTMDYNEGRLTITVDKDNRIQSVRIG